MDKVKKIAWGVIAFTALLVGFLAFNASKIEVDYDYEKYFPQNSESLKFYKNFERDFGSDNDFLLIAFVNHSNGVFNKEFLSKVKAIGDSISNSPHVESVISPVHNLNYAKQAGIMGIIQKPYINSSWNSLKEDSIRVVNAPKLMGNIFSKTLPAVSMYIKTKDKLPKDPSLELIDDLYKWLDKSDFEEYHISGRIIAQTYFIDKMILELGIFMTASVLLVIIFLWIAFRNFWSIVIPITTVLFAIISTVAVMYLTGKSFDILMVMLPTIIFVVGMSDLVHFLSKYLDELRYGKTKFNALKKAYKEVGLATFLTSLTTAIGFFSLTTAEIIPIKEFGIYSGIGVFIAYFFAFTFLPACYVILPAPKKILNSTKKLAWLNFLNRSFMGVIKYRRVIISGFSILVILSVLGISKLKINNYLLEDLSKDDPHRVDFEFFENHFSGVRPFELHFVAKNGTKIMDYENAVDINKIEDYLNKYYALGGIGLSVSPLDPIRMGYYIKHQNNIEYFKIPDNEKRYNNMLKQLNRMSLDAEVNNTFISKDSIEGKISGKIRDLGGYIMEMENEALMKFINDSIQPKNLEVTLTGTAILIDENNETLVDQLLLGLLIALFIVGGIMGLIFKSFKLVFISLIPNVIPLVLIGGVMYVANFDVKISTTLIFTLAFGIAVDDTIHFLSKLKLEMNKGHQLLFALRRTYISTGKAIIVTTLILCGGFITLMASTFTSTYTMGLLICITLLFAVLIDLTILPLLLIKWFVKPLKKGTVSKKLKI